MKIIKKIYIALLASTTLIACSDILEKQPLDTINTSNFFRTEEDAINAINGAYQPLQWPKLYNMRMWTSDIMAGNSIVGAGGGDDGRETQDMANFVTATDNPGVLDLWRGPAPGILRANTVLKNVPQMEIDQELKSRILGEAHFLRAHYYFILVRYFGDVPLITEPQNPEDDLRPTRTPKEEVFDLIINDFSMAFDLLPPKSNYAADDLGRACKGAAAGMLAKVYLTLGQYQNSLDMIAEVEALGYELNPIYEQNFDAQHENDQESLFEVQYFGKTSNSFWGNENQASWVSTFTGPRNADMVAGGYGWNQPTQEFVNSYEEGDLRKDATILYEEGPQFDGQEYDSDYSTTGYNLRKFLVPKSISPNYDTNPLNFPVLRFSDVLLMKAEALNELGRTSEAETPLNKVRDRAGLDPVSGLSQEEFRMKVLHERRIELAFEGQRWFDLIRVNGGQYGLDFLHSIGKSNASEKHLLFPIPQKEIDVNPNLTQNMGY
ncbi:RagB/SusD family nutrient uptake outer membrane protein [Echinicola jeungdonensis]|uniref:RagB/SusD family nutrient uptake outer membrane protein n=1 Tax=Echinicola jeungdonensis TaxID=709343 RepID=A0ABV5J3V3_9BACT|nr:RagB/SusD family nutrient uptake outer membrane protein [Echinicola jeungdonensis]MDN3670666.1 RagB/SusD family nutrient uptake outer membrane protein [Echinicola jeungdonensis]